MPYKWSFSIAIFTSPEGILSPDPGVGRAHAAGAAQVRHQRGEGAALTEPHRWMDMDGECKVNDPQNHGRNYFYLFFR